MQENQDRFQNLSRAELQEISGFDPRIYLQNSSREKRRIIFFFYFEHNRMYTAGYACCLG